MVAVQLENLIEIALLDGVEDGRVLIVCNVSVAGDAEDYVESLGAPQQRLDGVQEIRVCGRLHQCTVEHHVELGKVSAGLLHGGEDRARRLKSLARMLGYGDAKCRLLDCEPQDSRLGHVISGEARHDWPDVGEELQQPLPYEASNRLTNGDLAGSQGGSDLVHHDSVAGLEFSLLDLGTDVFSRKLSFASIRQGHHIPDRI